MDTQASDECAVGESPLKDKLRLGTQSNLM